MESLRTHSEGSGDAFLEWRAAIRRTFESQTANGRFHLFRTEVEGDLFTLMLDNLPQELRQHHNCYACREFFRKYANLVVIHETGILYSALWDEDELDDNSPYLNVAWALRTEVERARIYGAFASTEEEFGVAETGPWSHHAVRVPPLACWKNNRHVSEYTEQYLMVSRAIVEFPYDVCIKAQTMLKSGLLTQGEKSLPILDWFIRLLERTQEQKRNDFRNNFIWSASATAPPGFRHIKNTTVGNLLTGVIDGASTQALQNMWNEQASPENYQRPKAAPSEGNIERAKSF